MTDRITERCSPESRFGGFTDIGGTLAFYPRRAVSAKRIKKTS